MTPTEQLLTTAITEQQSIITRYSEKLKEAQDKLTDYENALKVIANEAGNIYGTEPTKQ